MNNGSNIQEELNAYNSTLPAGVPFPYTVPEGYFDSLPFKILAAVKSQPLTAKEEITELSPLLAAIPRQTPFTIPEGYFSNTLLDVSALTQEDVLPDILAKHDKVMPYQVPDRYFNELPQQVIKKIKNPPAKVISFPAARWMRIAAAAVVAGAIILGGLLYFNTKPSSSSIAASHDWVASTLKKVSTQELDEFLSSTAADHDHSLAKKEPNKEVRKLLHDVSTKELDAFLQEVPDGYDEAAAN